MLRLPRIGLTTIGWHALLMVGLLLLNVDTVADETVDAWLVHAPQAQADADSSWSGFGLGSWSTLAFYNEPDDLKKGRSPDFNIKQKLVRFVYDNDSANFPSAVLVDMSTPEQNEFAVASASPEQQGFTLIKTTSVRRVVPGRTLQAEEREYKRVIDDAEQRLVLWVAQKAEKHVPAFDVRLDFYGKIQHEFFRLPAGTVGWECENVGKDETPIRAEIVDFKDRVRAGKKKVSCVVFKRTYPKTSGRHSQLIETEWLSQEVPGGTVRVVGEYPEGTITSIVVCTGFNVVDLEDAN